jgi:hypothetical protein
MKAAWSNGVIAKNNAPSTKTICHLNYKQANEEI